MLNRVRQYIGRQSFTNSKRLLSSPNRQYDATQEQLMEEVCIVVDENDVALRGGTKRECHEAQPIQQGLLHRAFSVFLFNEEGQLLLQQRAQSKITFPLCWTNTCCSHPLYHPPEMELKDEMGIRRAAQRKLEHELGIPKETFGVNDFVYLTRIHYLAMSDPVWGEHEIDYILFAQKPKSEIPLHVNPNEVAAIEWVGPSELRPLLAKYKAANIPISPWFDLIADTFLASWWADLPNIMANKGIEPALRQKIHRLSRK
eukprot:TRINITY_DN868_c0_g7_i1.p1 TRINITY_DN868_c0_g7~~TRINITY_DN868_c0_g7_i1.p1  ORF type:complete len:258 (+),score=33.36 TRINITY_DN868_c0_g7_i1:61-834(+)